MVVFLALLASCLYALASVCQRLGVEATPGETTRTGLIHQMVRRRIWIVGFGVMTLGYLVQSIALHLGSVAVVQPLMVSELLAVVAILWFWYATPWRARDVVSVLLAVAGLVTFLVVASPSEGTSSPHAARWIITSVVIAALAATLIALGSRGPDWWRAMFLGSGASVGFAFLAVVTKSLTAVLMSDWVRALISWQLLRPGVHRTDVLCRDAARLSRRITRHLSVSPHPHEPHRLDRPGIRPLSRTAAWRSARRHPGGPLARRTGRGRDQPVRLYVVRRRLRREPRAAHLGGPWCVTHGATPTP